MEREYVDPSLAARADWLAAKSAAREAVRDDGVSGKEAATRLLKATGDAFTRLVDAKEASTLLETYTTGKRSSLGGLRLAKDGAVLAAPPGSQLAEGDVVLTVDGEPLSSSSFGALDGEPGSTVELGVQRRNDRLVVRLTRREPKPLVTTTTSSDGRHFVRIESFATGTADALQRQSLTLKDVVIDLRGNGGGSVEGAIDSAALFLDKGTVVATVKTRSGDKVRLEPKVASTVGPFSAKRVTLLVDRGTASAAELFAAALAEHGRATTVGCCADRTYGKARVQRVEPLPGGDLLLVSRALYETPVLHRDLSGVGLTPDSLQNDPACCPQQKKSASSSSAAACLPPRTTLRSASSP